MKLLTKLFLVYFGMLALSAVTLPMNVAAEVTGQIESGRQNIIKKLDSIRLDRISFERLSLAEVVRQLNEAARQNDSEKTGVQISIATNSISDQSAHTNSVVVNMPSLADVRLADVLDAVVIVADKPIKYSILDDGIVFSARSAAADAKLFTRTFRVNLATLRAGLESVGSFHGTPIFTNAFALSPSEVAKKIFTSLGVNWQNPPGKSVIYNDQPSTLVVTATEVELDTIERAISVLNSFTPKIPDKALSPQPPK